MRTTFITDKKEIESIIQQCDICTIGLNDTDGFPYVIPMNFAYADDGDIILHSGPEGKHLNLIGRDNKISISFCSDRKLRYQHQDMACSYSVTSQSVLCKGSVSFIEDIEEKRVVMQFFMEHYVKDKMFTFSEPALRNVKLWRVKVSELTAKSFGQNFRT